MDNSKLEQSENSISSGALYYFPVAARFGRKIPKEKIYQYGTLGKGVKKQFIEQVEKITWQYKLAPETINIPASKSVPEIQVFDIQLKSGVEKVSNTVLQAIDKAIAFPIYFRIFRSEGNDKLQVMMSMAYKRPSEADSSKWVIGEYFNSEWTSANNQPIEQPIPVALNLKGIYELLLRSLINQASKIDEDLASLVARITNIRAVETELGKCQAKLNKEKQFNRKVEINQRVNKLKQELERLA